MIVRTDQSTEEAVLIIGLYQERTTRKIMMPLTRSKAFNHPKWKIPGGGVEPGESPIQAAKREYHEENGLLVENPYFVEVVRKPSRSDPSRIHIQHILVAQIQNLIGFNKTAMDGDELLTNAIFDVNDIRQAMSHNVRLEGYEILHFHISPLMRALEKIFG